MGYRSEVWLSVAVPTQTILSELVSVYALDERVKKHKVLDDFAVKLHTNDCYFFTLTIHATDTKWYEMFEDVQAAHYLAELCQSFYQERGDEFAYAYKFIRIGEETGDIENDSHESNNALGQLMADEMNDHAWSVQMIEVVDTGKDVRVSLTPNGLTVE